MIELIEWDGLRLVVRGESVDREQVEWMTDSFFWAEFLEAAVRPGDTVFDRGSHIGSFGLRASAHRQCCVWAAEPDRESATIHRINAAINQLEPLQEICQLAAGEHDGILTLHEATTNWAHNVVGVSSKYNVLTGRTKKVDSLSLAGCFERSKASACRFMKMNIEGAEGGFIRGATLTDLRRIGHIVAELHFDLAARDTEGAIVDKLREADFTVKVSPDEGYDARSWLLARR